jgi:transcriptional regulator with XRE-family HTH domain
MSNPEEIAKNIYSAICQRIRSIRLDKRMTLDDLAEKTGFAKSYLSQIETQKREPPISTLTKIAFVLGVDVFFLISGENRQGDEQSITIVRSTERRVIPRASGSPAYMYEPVNFKKLDRLMDGYIVTIGPEFPTEPLVHEGQELACVLEGSQEFMYDGRSYIFERGDCYYFNSNKPHYARSVGDGPAKVLVVFTSKKERSMREISAF